jgi:hypothetical protein
VQFQSSGLQAPSAPVAAGLAPGAPGARAPIGLAAAKAAAAAAAAAMAGQHGGGVPRAPISSSDPRLIQAQAVAQALAAKAGLPPAPVAKPARKWDT